MDVSKRAAAARSLTTTAREMIERARELEKQSKLDPARRDVLLKEAKEWLDKAKEVARSANRIAS